MEKNKLFLLTSILFLVASCVGGEAKSTTIDLTPYAGQTVTFTVIVPGTETTDPTDPTPVSYPIGEFDFGVSDSKPGYYYFIVAGDNKSLTIGGSAYVRSGDYYGKDLWYGTSTGAIILTGKDGKVYVGTTSSPAIETGSRTTLKYNRNTNGNRPTYYTYNSRILKVGDKVKFQIGNITKSFTARVRANKSIGEDWADGTVVKNSDVSGRGVAILIPSKYANNHPSTGWVEW